jgi:hypothetical protein
MKNYKQYLTEVKLSRVFNHFTNPDIPVGVITTFRKDKPVEDGLRDNKILAQKLRSAGYGYVWVDGAWKETNEETGEKVDVQEDSILVIGSENDNDKLYNILLENTKKYEQDGFMFKPEGSTEVFIIDKEGNKDKIASDGKDFKRDKFEYGYTILRGGGAGKIFSLHEACVEDSGIGRRIKQIRSKK